MRTPPTQRGTPKQQASQQPAIKNGTPQPKNAPEGLAKAPERIIGDSAALRAVLKKVETVAPTRATVLIQGETGTGKELIALTLHGLSQRKEKALIRINCAAIPSALLESDLFGHEKGSFTGAHARKIGRIQLADEGTLFLDEVGDIPLEMQPKLLRVLQEQEFERVGGLQSHSVNVRLVAATSRDLGQMVRTDSSAAISITVSTSFRFACRRYGNGPKTFLPWLSTLWRNTLTNWADRSKPFHPR